MTAPKLSEAQSVLKKLAGAERLELTTYGFGDRKTVF